MSASRWFRRVLLSGAMVLATSSSLLARGAAGGSQPVEHELAGRTLEATQTLAGPVAGIGIYF